MGEVPEVFPPEVMERAVRMVFDAKDQCPSQWAAIESTAGKIGCTVETLRKWVRQCERDSGARPGPIDDHGARHGIEPICSALQVAPSAYRRRAARHCRRRMNTRSAG